MIIPSIITLDGRRVVVEYIPRQGISRSQGAPKIVHHTTEGGFAGSLVTLENRHVESHFLVGDDHIVQFIDTELDSKSLVNKAGGVETNRDGYVFQLELVGFAHLPKSPRVLANTAAICRLLEAHYNIPRVWPNGKPVPYPLPIGAKYNRDATVWQKGAGHYGHCSVPENFHGDPGYTTQEADLVVPPM